MKGFVTIIAASAVLSASFVAGLAATGAPSEGGAGPGLAATSGRPAPATAWVDPPARAAAVPAAKAAPARACPPSAWPYAAACTADAGPDAGAAPERKVRMIVPAATPATLALR